MRYLVYLMTLLFSTAVAQNPTILQGNYISNVFGQSNFVKNPNAQTGTGYVSSSSATVTRSTTTPLVATSEFNWTASAGGFSTWSTRPFDAGMKNQNCEARFTYRGFTAGTTTAQVRNSGIVIAELVLTPSATDPRIASINFPCGDLSLDTNFRLLQSGATLGGINEIGGIYVGLATNMANIAQAEFVGRLNFDNDCTFSANTASWPNNPTDATCTTTTVGSVSAIPGVSLGVRINNAKSGRYYVVLTGTFQKDPASSGGQCRVAMSNGIGSASFPANYFAYTALGIVTTSGVTSLATPLTLSGTFDQATTGTVDVYGHIRNNGSSPTCTVNNNGAYGFAIEVYRFPSSSELVVTPERQN
jgi:hypothetical protein